MFSKKTILIIGMIALVIVHLIILSLSIRKPSLSYPSGGTSISVIAPFQSLVTRFVRSLKQIWRRYFYLVHVAETNEKLEKLLEDATSRQTRCREIELANLRLRNELNFQKSMDDKVLSAEVVGKDPSPWFKSVMVDRGEVDGVRRGLPVVVPQGIVGIITDVTFKYSKVLLIVDRNCAVAAMIQRNRARGIINGKSGGQCSLNYILRKHDIIDGDTVISSGLDGVFPKGLRIGKISDVAILKSGIFQEVTVDPFVDFETLEEVIIILNPRTNEFMIR
jgi:rod shape-determining protein MreC